jgi:hypothetical protein
MNHTLYTVSPRLLEVSTREALRYLNIKSPDEALLRLTMDCIDEAKSVASLKAVYVKSGVTVENDTVRLDFMGMKSKKLAAFLDGCKEAYVFAATMGMRADMLVNRYLKAEPSRGVIFNAACVAVIEAFCDKLNGYLLGKEKSGRRFSPGYGDLKLEYQRELLSCLNADRLIGVTLTDACLMVPTKSVSAVIGIKQSELK